MKFLVCAVYPNLLYVLNFSDHLMVIRTWRFSQYSALNAKDHLRTASRNRYVDFRFVFEFGYISSKIRSVPSEGLAAVKNSVCSLVKRRLLDNNFYISNVEFPVDGKPQFRQVVKCFNRWRIQWFMKEVSLCFALPCFALTYRKSQSLSWEWCNLS